MVGGITRMKRMKKQLAILVCGVAVTACGANNQVTASASYFQGLPPSVVREMLALPYSQEILRTTPVDEGQLSLAQAMVRNMIFCRSELNVYDSWIATGHPGPITPGPVPARPLQPGNSAILQDYASLRAAVRSGDRRQLLADLVDNGSCGHWVPATAGSGARPSQRMQEPALVRATWRVQSAGTDCTEG